MLPHSHTFEAIGTSWCIQTAEPLSSRLIDVVARRIDEFDRTYSRFRSDSLVSRIARTAGEYNFPPDVAPLLEIYWKLYELTDGKFTPLVGAMLERAGYDAQYSFRSSPQQLLPRWESVMRWDGQLLRTTEPLKLDFGAAGKGYLVDIIGGVLQAAGIWEYVIDASGDIRQHTPAVSRIGLEYPFDPSKIIGVANISGNSLCASAVQRRTWGNGLHHIFNPDTLAPVNAVVATWVVADSTMVADGLATALFLADPARLRQAYDYQYVRMFSDGSIDYSVGFDGELF